MKKRTKILISALSVVLSAPLWPSCGKIALDEEGRSSETSDCILTFQLFTPSVSRATSAADFKFVWVMDLVDDKVIQIVEQKVGQTPDFGSPTLHLSAGKHVLRFFATDAPSSVLQGETVLQNPLGDSFCQTVTIDTRKVSGTQRVILQRKVAKVLYEGEEAITLNGILSGYDLRHNSASNSPVRATLGKGDFLYTYIPETGCLTFNDGTKIPVSANQVTSIQGDGSHEGGDLPPQPSDHEYMVWESDTALFYVSENEISDIILSEIPNPRSYFAGELGIYRMPTRREAWVLHNKTLPSNYWTGSRCLCYDSPQDEGYTQGTVKYGTGKYFSFLWGSGAVSAAGQKTAYSIMPIRTAPIASVGQSFQISADFTWDSDTIFRRSSAAPDGRAPLDFPSRLHRS